MGIPLPYFPTEDSNESSLEPTRLPGIVAELGELGVGAIITEEALAKMFGRHRVSIKRAVERGELPHPTRLLGGPVWTAGVLVRHIEKRLEAAAKEAEKLSKRLKDLGP